MCRVTRRQLLRHTTQAGLALGASRFLTGCGQGADPLPPLDVPSDVPYDDDARVVAVRGNDLFQMTRKALDAVGGMATIVQPGETVFIKPNFGGLGWVGYDPILAGECTKPEILIVTAEECLKAGADRVIIGEAGQVRQIDFDAAWSLDGTVNLVTEAQRLSDAYPGQVELASLMIDSPEWDPVPSPHTGLGEIYVSSLITPADRVISIAPVKSHRWTSITGAMKNFVGATSFDTYGDGQNWRFRLHDAAGGVAQCFLDIVNGIKPDLAIIDGSICCEGNGPHVMPGWWGTTVDVRDRLGDWFLLASTDLAAADATVARVTSHDVDQIPYLGWARQQGIGQVQEDRIELAGATLDELRIPWEPADHIEGFGEVIVPGIMLQFFSDR